MSTVLASHEEIVKYWEVHEDECGLGVDWAEARERCWRCGCEAPLERCHVVPASLGGSSDPSNLVLLCSRCHREAPNVADPRFMWIWLRATCVPLYDTYWTVRGVQEFETMFGRKPFAGPKFAQVEEETFKELFRKELANSIIHFAEPGLNPATIAAIFARIEERLTGTAVVPDRSRSNSRYFHDLGHW